MIQPQVPLRLPCYDLPRLTDSQFEPTLSDRPSLGVGSAGLTGGVCKEQGRIHRAMLRRDYYGLHLHEGEFQPSIRAKARFRDSSPFRGRFPLSGPL